MTGLWLVLALSLLPGAGNFVGALLAEFTKPTPRMLNWALHAAAGIVIAVVSVELMPEALKTVSGFWAGLAFGCGGVAYVLIDRSLSRLMKGNAGNRVRTGMWMVYVAVAVDLTSDGLLIGSGSAVSPALALALAAGQVLADVPEGFATVANFQNKDVPRRRRLLLATSFFAFVSGAAALSYFALRDAPTRLKMSALVFAAGLLTVAAVEDMLEEAHDAHDDSQRSVLAFVGGFVLFTMVSAGLDSLSG